MAVLKQMNASVLCAICRRLRRCSRANEGNASAVEPENGKKRWVQVVEKPQTSMGTNLDLSATLALDNFEIQGDLNTPTLFNT